MSKRGNGYDSENRVNILKKVKIGKTWNLYPAVVEPNGKLRDKVRVRGKIEVHPEGYYYIENGYCESFNGKLRDECLNGEILLIEGGADRDRKVAGAVQHTAPAPGARLRAACPGGL